jgi:ATPase family associated with various cellular activities (AAA)
LTAKIRGSATETHRTAPRIKGVETNPQALIATALNCRSDAVFFTASQLLSDLYPDMGLVETEDDLFKLHHFAWAKKCRARLMPEIHSQTNVQLNAAHKSLWTESRNAWYKVTWRDHELNVVTLSVAGITCDKDRHYIVAPTKELAEKFIYECCDWNSEIRGEVLVFSGGWLKDADLFRSIQGTTLDSLVLERGLKEEIYSDFLRFFDSKSLYENHRIPWKRGVLFLGPPGNGKTHAIKGLVNLMKLPCLYVRSFKNQYQTDHKMIQQVFARARTTAPCLLVFEDLDALLDDNNRSYFLNELDGFAANEGIMTIATTNHPERLDPAILDRPSRFDRKYTFHIPDQEERQRYLALRSEGLEQTLRLSPDEIEKIANLTEDFSFAYLKELVLSAMMKWISAREKPPMLEVMSSQIDALRLQMRTPTPEPRPEPSRDLPGSRKWSRK